MNQTEQMRELCPSCRNADIYACTCPFKTARNSQPECFEPAKLVRLTEDDLEKIYMRFVGYEGLSPRVFHDITGCVMAAMIAKNGGSHATD